MDISDILSFRPASTPKRPLEGDDDEDNETAYRQRKLRRIARAKAAELEREAKIRKLKAELERKAQMEAENDKQEEANVSDVQKQQIQEYIENTELNEVEVLNETSLKRLILLFEKRSLRNQEMRIKFPDAPAKFMESELELHQTIVELHAVTTTPDLYTVFVQLSAVSSILELLLHENTDIAVAIVNLLHEMTDVDILHESEEGAEVLIEALIEKQICALLVQNMERMDESVKEEAMGIHNSLAIIENLAEFRPDVCEEVAKQGLFHWLLRRLRVKYAFDANKLYASEILAILLQNTPANRELIGELDGIDIILQQLAHYKRYEPSCTEEQEMMENLFNCLCSCLMHNPNKEKFLIGEGLQLMNLMLREKKLSRNGSLKVLDHAMSGPEGKDNANKFVDILGLRAIFPLFMKTPKKNRKKFMTVEDHEEHVLAIICSMVKNCRGAQRQRLMSKFTENDLEKVDRLLELHFKYLRKVEKVDGDLEQVQKYNVEELNEETTYMKRLDGGLFILQLVDYIMVEISASGPSSIKQRMVQMINQRGGSLKTVRHIMREYAGNLGDAGKEDVKTQEENHILQLIDKF